MDIIMHVWYICLINMYAQNYTEVNTHAQSYTLKCTEQRNCYAGVQSTAI